MTTDMLTYREIRADIADVIGVAEDALCSNTSLVEQGLDSIRLMALVERWRARGARVGFAALAERPTLEHWRALLATPSETPRG